jgi:hypothetical protein
MNLSDYIYDNKFYHHDKLNFYCSTTNTICSLININEDNCKEVLCEIVRTICKNGDIDNVKIKILQKIIKLNEIKYSDFKDSYDGSVNLILF